MPYQIEDIEGMGRAYRQAERDERREEADAGDRTRNARWPLIDQAKSMGG